MQLTHTPGGDTVAVLTSSELLVAEAALMRQVAATQGKSPLAIAMMQTLEEATWENRQASHDDRGSSDQHR